MKLYSIAVSIIALALLFSLVSMNPTPYHTYTQQLESDVIMTDDDALAMCEDLGLVYDYYATGYTVADLCYSVEDSMSWDQPDA